ncbi:hypothetical protein F8388_010328 [Cannabis sativa]|uniref:Uncharacterized protein n=1 Tax=Cannabis sativa TaxID=3483 RepID=A0A7J6GS80_CANSA|nr:hypothetical protein F8388_010328 [Cannabis sativa]
MASPTMEDNEVAIDIEAMSSSLENRLSGNLVMSSNFCIFKVPTILSRHTKNAYEPNAFAIGPFHHKKPHLQPTERIKQKYLLDLLSRLSHNNNNNPISNTEAPFDPMWIRKLSKAINEIQNKAHGYYAGPTDMSTTEFVEMLLLDGCFIIELFRKNSYQSDLIDKDDPIFTMSCLLQFLHHDLILLENQIPWFVLNTLFDLTKSQSTDKKSLVELALEFFPSLIKKKPFRLNLSNDDHRIQQTKHILDLLRNSLIWNSKVIGNDTNHDWQHIRTATGLRDSGIKFEASNSESILDISFIPRRGVVSIPPLLIQETTETMFRNLISLEQCCPNYKPIITCYAVLLDNLIDTNADIQVLEKNKVIDNWLNVDDATKFFNRLYIDTYVKENYYYCLTSKVNDYCKQRRHKYRRILKRDYFNHPWALVSVIGAFVALVLTFLQTFYAIQDAYKEDY